MVVCPIYDKASMRNVVVNMVFDRQLAFLKNLVELFALLPV